MNLPPFFLVEDPSQLHCFCSKAGNAVLLEGSFPPARLALQNMMWRALSMCLLGLHPILQDVAHSTATTRGGP